MKTHFKKLRNPNYVGSWDLADENGNFNDKVVTITSVAKDMVFDGKGGQEECVVVKFAEVKPMVCNSTNLRAISKNLGSPYIEDWAGKKITLTVQKVKAFGEVHDALRIKKYVEPTKPTLSPERFKAALESIAKKTYTKEKLMAEFALTPEQLNGL
jgi:hypothetical protein